MDDNRIYKSLDDLTQEVHEIRQAQHELKLEMTRYKGFLGGIMFIISGCSVAATLAVQYLKKAV